MKRYKFEGEKDMTEAEEGYIITPEEAVNARTENDKRLIIERLKKVPIVQTACEKVGISRSTYYRWRKEDLIFAALCDHAIKEGILLINDLAENQLMRAISETNMTAIIYWLKHHHPTYREKIQTDENEGKKPITIVSWSDGQPVSKGGQNK